MIKFNRNNPDMWNLPNKITLIRILMIPIFIIVYYLPLEGNHIISAIIFAVAALTDWVDGFIARKYDMVTKFGEFLDPLADKLIVVAALALLLEVYATPWFAIPAILIIGRELVISGLREWMAKIGLSNKVKVSMIGKVKTWVQMIAIAVLLIASNEYLFFTSLGFILIYAAAFMSVWSMIHYLKQAWPQLMGNNH